MNYGKKFKYIMISASGMFIGIVGLAFKTGYYPGHSIISAYGLMAAGLFLTIYGLINLSKYK